MNRKILYLLCLMCLLVSSPLYAKSKSSKDTPGSAIFVMSYAKEAYVSTKSFSYTSDFLALDMKVPQIEGLTSRSFEKEINKQLLRDAKLRKKNMINEAKLYNKDMIRDGLTPIKFEYLESYNIIPSPGPYLTIELFKYQYSGGAHGLSELGYLTIDTEKNKIVQLSDLFKDNIDYTKLINEQINEAIKLRMKQGEYFFVGENGFISIKKDPLFYINKNNQIVIVFNVYEIAPYAAGPVQFPLNTDILLPYMK